MATFSSLCLVDYLCGLVNTRCLNPTSQSTFQLSDLAQIMSDEMFLQCVPLMKKTGQNFFVYNVDQAIVAGKSAYTFPPRAVGNAVRDVVLLDSAGNEVALNNLEREYIKVQFPFNYVPSIWSFGQYGTANEINLYNTLIQSYQSYTLRFITERRPGALTLSSNCGYITAITGNVITLSYVDPTWTTSTTFDIINQAPPFQSLADNVAITAINGFQLTLSTAAAPSGVTTGMWFCPAMLSCIPQIPYDFFPLITEYTVATVAEALDMSQLLAASKAKIERYESNALALIKPRVPGSPKVIINKDAFSRGGIGGMGGGWR